MQRARDNCARVLSTALLMIVIAGCATTMSQSFSGNIAHAILNQNDPETVRAGAPAFMLLLDGFIADNPRQRDLLRGGADLYGVYATVFVEDRDRAQRLARKSLDYARAALCAKGSAACGQLDQHYADFTGSVGDFGKDDIGYLFSFAAAWANWIHLNRDDWMLMADLAKVNALMHRVVELDPAWKLGRAQLYLGVINSQLPAALGGLPEHGREHFEKALASSAGRDLAGKVEYARHYARLVFDQDLHDRLLREVLAADPVFTDLTLSNVIAQQQARQLLESSNEYFEE